MAPEINDSQPFAIKDCALIAIATGKRAQNLRELREFLSRIDPESIYYHFWGSLLRPRFDDPEYHNDFSLWAAHSLHDKILAERLAVIDPTAFRDMEELRFELVEVIEERLDEVDYPIWARSDHQFEFIRSQIVIFDTHHTLQQPADFVTVVPKMSVGSIFYHFIDARRRHPEGINDFQNWLRYWGDKYEELEQYLNGIDPYFSSLIELREELSYMFRNYFREAEEDEE